MAIENVHGVATANAPPVVHGFISNSPSSPSGALFVYLPSTANPEPWGPVPWTAPSGALPVVGQECLVAFDERGLPWVVAFIGLASLPAPGDLRLTARSPIETGWLACEGQSVLRTDYPLLFAAIGVAYGAVDGTHFTLPDYRERAPVGAVGAGAYALGKSGGASTVTLTVGQMPKHKHPPAVGGRFFQESNNTLTVATGTQQFTNTGLGTETGEAGGGEAHPNVSPYTTCNVWIKT